MTEEEQMRIDDIYKNMPLEEIPWNNEAPPKLLVELLDSGKIQRCKAIDLGCGAGNYIIYLAEQGFEATGVDISPAAIEIARKNADKRGIKCDFIIADVVEGLSEIDQTWDFAYDWGMLHHILPQSRKKYVENVYRILNPQGKYLSTCFSEKDSGFGSEGKYMKTRLGTTLYFSSEDELRKLFESFFQIKDQRTVKIEGKFKPHIFNYVFMERK
jgi:cyclopropane fatty-acyl-phospholipid synthase-like methyltransferase